MQNDPQIAKLRAEQKKLRIRGAVLMIASHSLLLGIYSITGEETSLPVMLLLMLAMLIGFILFMRSFFHFKFAPLRKEKKQR